MPVKYTSTFRAPSEYERQIEEARRRQMLADVLAQQQYEPSEGNAAPIPRAAPLVKALQSYLTARQATQARQAGEEAKAMEGDYAQRMLGRMEGGYTYDPKAQPVTVPEQTQLEEVTRQSQYKRSPEQALQMASTTLGTAALKDRPVMAARLAQMLEAPKTAEYGTTVQYDDKGQGYVVSKAGDVKILPGVKKPEEKMTPYQEAEIKAKNEELAWKKSKAGEAAERPKAPSGFRYTTTGDLEAIPGGPQDLTRPINMPASVHTQVVTEQTNSRQFATASQRTQKFIDDIEKGKLPLYKGAGLVYGTERMFGGNEVLPEEQRPAYDRYYELERFVTEQVNTILSRAKGPQTDQDAIRARQQILDNLDNKQVVVTALRTLDRLWNDEINLSESKIDDLYAQYNQPRKGKTAAPGPVIDLPPRR